MDYDNKVASSSVSLFLGEELKRIKAADFDNSYNIIDEYAKTQKNYDTKPWILLGLSFLLSILITIGVTFFVSYSNKRIAIKIDTFDDLNLRNLLDMVSRTQSLYEESLKQKAYLEAAFASELKQAEQKRDTDYYTVNSMSSVSDDATIAKRRWQIKNEYDKTVALLHDKYDVEIQKSDNEVKMYQQALSEYDSNQIEQAQKEAAAMNSQKQLYEIETKKLKDKYEKTIEELRLTIEAMQASNTKAQRNAVQSISAIYQKRIAEIDPVIEDDFADMIISECSENQYTSFAPDNYMTDKNEKSLFASRLKSVQNDFEHFNYIADKVLLIPWEHNTLSYIEAMKTLSHRMCFDMTRTAHQLNQSVVYLSNELVKSKKELTQTKQALSQSEAMIKDKTYEINCFKALAQSMAQSGDCDGFILFCDNDGSIYSWLTDEAWSHVKQDSVMGVIKDGRKTLCEIMVSDGLEYPDIVITANPKLNFVDAGNKIYLNIKK